MSDKQKWELPVTGQVKIQQHDDKNFTVLKKVSGINPRTKKEVTSWKIQGYYGTVRKALLSIIEKDVLVDLDTVETLRGYIEATQVQYRIVERLLEGADE